MRRLFILIALLACVIFMTGWQFAVIGDPSIGEEGELNPPVLEQAVQLINDSDVELTLIAGDLTAGRTISRSETKQQYDRVQSILKNLQSRILVVPGNHDVDGAGGAEEFAARFPRVPWIIQHRGWNFIGLSTEEPGKNGLIKKEQLLWLQKQLEAQTIHGRTVVMMHRPVWPTPLEDKRMRAIPQDGLNKLFVNSGVRAVFTGHEHHFHHETKDDIEYVITGGGGSSLTADGAFHFTLVNVEDGRLTLKRIPIK